MTEPVQRRKAWFDPRLELRPSKIEGTGVIATAAIEAGAILFIPGEGITYTSDDFKSGRVKLDGALYNEAQLDDDLFVATLKSEDMSYYVAHSCDPNMWGGLARRRIEADGRDHHRLCVVHSGPSSSSSAMLVWFTVVPSRYHRQRLANPHAPTTLSRTFRPLRRTSYRR